MGTWSITLDSCFDLGNEELMEGWLVGWLVDCFGIDGMKIQ